VLLRASRPRGGGGEESGGDTIGHRPGAMRPAQAGNAAPIPTKDVGTAILIYVKLAAGCPGTTDAFPTHALAPLRRGFFFARDAVALSLTECLIP
jgi:hypothetical protein